MAPRNRFETEYNANFKSHEVHALLRGQPPPLVQDILVHKEPETLNNRSNNIAQVIAPSKPKENRALQYKAGLAPSMPVQKKLRYLSEYQKQFEWKRPLEQEAPILSAEKIVYGGQGNVHPGKKAFKIPKKTEYQLQFVRHPIVTSPKARREEADKNKATGNPIGWQEPGDVGGKPIIKPAQPSPIIPRKAMEFQSEYLANFQSPSNYKYVKGSWISEGHFQLQPHEKASDSESMTAWYQQVIELREKVRDYRSRAREGSHFLSFLKDLRKLSIPDEETAQQTTNKDAQQTTDQVKNKLKAQPESTDYQPPRKASNNSNEARKYVNPATTTAAEDRHSKGDRHTLDINAVQVISPVRDADHTPSPEDKPLGADSQNLLWNKKSLLAGPSMKMPKSFDSNQSNIASTTSRESSISSYKESNPARRPREAWPEYEPSRTRVVPPYGVASSITGADSRSDITFSEGEEDYTRDNKISPPEEPVPNPISQETRKLFTGKRLNYRDDRRRPTSPVDSCSSDDEGSLCSIGSKSSVLSIEAMEKRRAIASETLRRAKRRQAQL